MKLTSRLATMLVLGVLLLQVAFEVEAEAWRRDDVMSIRQVGPIVDLERIRAR